VIISHMHADHFSYGSLEEIEPKVGRLIVPKGALVYVPRFSFPTTELGRWNTWRSGGLSITATPVRHSGFRHGVDSSWMTTTYTGYVIEYRGMRVYFGGDTAYDPELFRETGRRFPGIDVAILPIAPGRPRDFMKDKHMDPEDAVQAFVDLGARCMVPMHFETFINGDDLPGEPERLLRAAARRRRLDDRIHVLAIGEQRVFAPRRRSTPP
jgi:N-acyl-phosphatidylethanolamine-hydrolysing phospholipase D